MSGKLRNLFKPLPRAAPAPAAPTAASPNARILLIHDSFNPQLAGGAEEGMREALSETGVALGVHALDRAVGDRVAAIEAILAAERPSGVVLLPPSSENDAVAALCDALGCRYVRLTAAPVGDPARCIASHDRAGAAIATQLLVASGHTLIGFVAGPDGELSARERELGFLDTLAEHALDRGATLIATGDWSFESGVAAGRLLLDVSPRPTAVIAASDGMAVGVLQAAREKGVPVPDQLSLIGFGDTPIATRLDPELTSVHVPAWEMGYAAAVRLIAPGTPEPARFACELAVRASTGPAAG